MPPVAFHSVRNSLEMYLRGISSSERTIPTRIIVYVRHDVHERLFKCRGAAARQVVVDDERAGSRAPLAFGPPVLPRELVHRLGPALVVAQGVD